MKEKGFFAAVSAFFIYREDEESNLTGVARYLQEQSEPNTEIGLGSEAAATGVAKYLQEQVETVAETGFEGEAVTGVARYLNEVDSGDQDQQVADVEDVAVIEAPVRAVEAPVYVNSPSKGLFATIRSFFGSEVQSEVTGVARYLQEQDRIEAEVAAGLAREAGLRSQATTSVTRYLEQSDSGATHLSTATDVVAEGVLILEEVPESVLRSEATSGVTRYLEQSNSSEERLYAAAEVVAGAISAMEAVEAGAESSEAYLERVEEPATGVARYIGGQAVIESELPLLTGVEMYLQDCDAARSGSTLTGVGAYVDQAELQNEAAAIIAKYQQQDEVQEEEVLALEITGVANYIEVNILNVEAEAAATGVVGYLDKAAKIAEAEAIVAKFLERQQALAEADKPVLSSVAQYIDTLENVDKAAASGVTAYMEKSVIDAEVADIIKRFIERELAVKEQAAAAKPQVNRKSVVKIRHRISSVDKYISKLEPEITTVSSELSGVERFVVEQELEAKRLEADEIIARYLARQAELSEAPITISGVARYIDNLPEVDAAMFDVSSVSRYLAKQPVAIVVDEIPEVDSETSVSRYLADNADNYDQARSKTGVAAYLANQIIAASQGPVEQLSGVDQYMISHG